MATQGSLENFTHWNWTGYSFETSSVGRTEKIRVSSEKENLQGNAT